MSTERSREMAALFQRAEDEGWKIADVAEAAGVAYGTATWWKRKLRESGELGEPKASFAALVSIDTVTEGCRTAPGCVLRCELPNGIFVHIEANVHDAAELLKSLSC